MPKFFADLTACQRGAPLLPACLGEITVFEVLDITLDKLAGIITLSAAGASSQFVQPPLDIRVQTDG
jgi:hypothetical protein